jgi:hypothetical protein
MKDPQIYFDNCYELMGINKTNKWIENKFGKLHAISIAFRKEVLIPAQEYNRLLQAEHITDEFVDELINKIENEKW